MSKWYIEDIYFTMLMYLRQCVIYIPVALYYDTVKDINCTIKLLHLVNKQM